VQDLEPPEVINQSRRKRKSFDEIVDH